MGLTQKIFTVHVVDDDASIRRALKRLLRAAGYHSVTYESAEAFIESVSDASHGCLVLDIRLPGMTGLDLQEKLAAGGSNFPVIFITARDNPQWRARAERDGAIAYLKKPFHEQALLAAIELAQRQVSTTPTR